MQAAQTPLLLFIEDALRKAKRRSQRTGLKFVEFSRMDCEGFYFLIGGMQVELACVPNMHYLPSRVTLNVEQCSLAYQFTVGTPKIRELAFWLDKKFRSFRAARASSDEAG